MAAKKSERGHYITCIGKLDTKDIFLLDLLLENGFMLQKETHELGGVLIECYKIYMEDLD